MGVDIVLDVTAAKSLSLSLNITNVHTSQHSLDLTPAYTLSLKSKITLVYMCIP